MGNRYVQKKFSDKQKQQKKKYYEYNRIVRRENLIQRIDEYELTAAKSETNVQLEKKDFFMNDRKASFFDLGPLH